jgi:hypothetical protein
MAVHLPGERNVKLCCFVRRQSSNSCNHWLQLTIFDSPHEQAAILHVIAFWPVCPTTIQTSSGNYYLRLRQRQRLCFILGTFSKTRSLCTIHSYIVQCFLAKHEIWPGGMWFGGLIDQLSNKSSVYWFRISNPEDSGLRHDWVYFPLCTSSSNTRCTRICGPWNVSDLLA